MIDGTLRVGVLGCGNVGGALVTILGRDREWNDGAAKTELLKIFEAAGPMSDVARQGRKRMASILFA